MNQKASKMLRRLRQGSKAGKRTYNKFTHLEKSEVRADYIDRGEQLQIDYTSAKKLVKKERMNAEYSRV